MKLDVEIKKNVRIVFLSRDHRYKNMCNESMKNIFQSRSKLKVSAINMFTIRSLILFEQFNRRVIFLSITIIKFQVI